MIARGEDDSRVEGMDRYKKINVFIDRVNEETGQFFRFDRFVNMASNLDESALTTREWVRSAAYTMEKVMHELRKQSMARGVEISTYTTFVDCSGVSLTGIASRHKFVLFMADLGAQHYPESLYKTVLFNTPWYFPQVLAFAKPFVDADTLSKLIVSSGVPLDEMLQLLPKSMILKAYGGENEAVLPQPTFVFPKS
jgi:hypothetical protein